MKFLLMLIGGIIVGSETTGAVSFLYPNLSGDAFWSFMIRTVAVGSLAGVALIAIRSRTVALPRFREVIGAWMLSYFIGIPITWIFMMSRSVGGLDLQPYKPLLFWIQFLIALAFVIFISNPKHIKEF